jgi:class 3 adenylate cyclase/tetratricopeptide (TPR) repeat protein
MTDPQLSQLERLQRSMKVLESRRDELGNEAVDPALFALEQQIAAFEEIQLEDVDQAEDRRIVTILFTDIVGSSAIASQLDPEDWREVVAALHTMAGKIVQEHEGTVMQYLGDGLLALFGAESSSERDPEYAIRAALAIQKNLPTLETEVPLQLRAGVNTGLVVLGEMGSEAKREFTASGESMNFTARLQEASPAGGVLISHSTYRHVRGLFDMTTQSPLKLKGRVGPQQTYHVHRVKSRPFQIASRGVLGVETPTVGREAESLELQRAYRGALEEKNQIWAQLVGMPGVGKTRLMAEIIEWLELQPEETNQLRAFAIEGDEKQPFALLRRMWFDHFQIPEDASRSKAEELWVNGIQSILGGDSEEPAHALGLLLGLPFEGSPHIGAMRHAPLQIKGRAFAVSRQLFDHLRASKPLVISIEDLHWADSSSWEYLMRVILEGDFGKGGVFIIAAARPEWQSPDPLHNQPGYVQIDLQPLSQEASYLLATELLHRVDIVPESILKIIADRSEGVPYFAEEIVNWLIDQKILDRSSDPWRFISTRFDQTPLPSTLQHLLLTRLNALNNVQRAVLQHGAIFGRSFWEGGLGAMGLSADGGILHQLKQRGFVEAPLVSSFEGEREWRFQHNLMRDVAYESVLKRQRPNLHKAAGEWLEAKARKTDRLDELAGIIGEHSERAGMASDAANWYLRAGKRARTQGALLEAYDFFDRTLELLPEEDRDVRWDVLLDRSEVLGLLSKPELRKENDALLLEIAKEAGDQYRLAEANFRRGSFLESTGDLPAALEAFGVALEASKLTQDQNLSASILAMMVVCQTRLGELRAADELAEEALLLSQNVDDKNALARILTNVGVYYSESGDIEQATRLAERQIEITHQLGDRTGEAVGLGNISYNYLQLGLFEKGRIALERALELNEALGAHRHHAYNLLNSGLAQWRFGEGRTAKQLLEQARPAFEAHGDLFGLGVMHSYKALAMEQVGDLKGASEAYKEAMDTLEGIGLHGFAQDALAGLARCAFAKGDMEAAKQYTTELCDYLDEHEAKNMEFPIQAYETCARIFGDLDDEIKSRAAIEGGYRELMSRADRIIDAEWRESFLENVPENRALMEMWDRMAGTKAKERGGEDHGKGKKS